MAELTPEQEAAIAARATADAEAAFDRDFQKMQELGITPTPALWNLIAERAAIEAWAIAAKELGFEEK